MVHIYCSISRKFSSQAVRVFCHTQANSDYQLHVTSKQKPENVHAMDIVLFHWLSSTEVVQTRVR